MNTLEYDRVIQEFCIATGMSPWKANETVHIDLSGTTIGLIYDADCAPDTLYAYFDLGTMQHADLHKRLLEENAAIDVDGNGYFCLHSESGSVIYRVNIRLTRDTDGASLAEDMKHFLESGKQRLFARSHQ